MNKKKLSLCILSFAFAFLSVSFISCKTSQVQNDFYSETSASETSRDETSISETSRDETSVSESSANEDSVTILKRSETKPKTQKSDPYSDEKIRGSKNFVQQLLNTEKYKKIENSSLFTKSFIGKMTQKQISLIHKPQTDLAGFLVRYDTSLYTFYMAEDDRKIFVDAVDKYLADFENESLEKKRGRKTESFYANALCFQEFGIVEAMMNNYSKPKVALGYSFSDGFPYFTLTVKPSKNLNPNINSNEVQQNIEQKYYFNVEQAKILQDFMRKENVNSLL